MGGGTGDGDGDGEIDGGFKGMVMAMEMAMMASKEMALVIANGDGAELGFQLMKTRKS